MLSIRDCLDYCDLTDEDVAIIAEHHDIPEAAAAQKPQPELHLKADRNARYEHVARLLYSIQQAGIQKVAFLTEPKGQS